MDGSSIVSADRYKYWHVDYQRRSVRIVCRDGQVFDEELDATHQRPDSQVATSTFDWEKWWIWSTITDETPDRDKFMAMLTMPSVILDTLIDPEQMPKDPLTTWVDHHSAITAQIHAENLPKEQRRRLARRRYWNENIGHYTAAYWRLTRSTNFPTFSDAELAGLFADSPMVGLVSELFMLNDLVTAIRGDDG